MALSRLANNLSVTAHDVLAIALRAILYYLCCLPDCRDRLAFEIREAERKKELSTPAKYTEVVQLPYLYVHCASNPANA